MEKVSTYIGLDSVTRRPTKNPGQEMIDIQMTVGTCKGTPSSPFVQVTLTMNPPEVVAFFEHARPGQDGHYQVTFETRESTIEEVSRDDPPGSITYRPKEKQ